MINCTTLKKLFGLLLFFILLVVNAYTQNSFSSLTISVTDAEQIPLANATITIKFDTNTVRYRVNTGTNGIYYIPSLPPGNYTIKAEKDGYEQKEQTVVVSLGEPANVEFVLLPWSTKGKKDDRITDSTTIKIKPTQKSENENPSIPDNIVKFSGKNENDLKTILYDQGREKGREKKLINIISIETCKSLLIFEEGDKNKNENVETLNATNEEYIKNYITENILNKKKIIIGVHKIENAYIIVTKDR